MPKLPPARPASVEDRLRAAQGDAPVYKKEIPDGWRDALLSGDLALYAAMRIDDFIDSVSLNIGFALNRPDRAGIVAAVALYDAAGSLWDSLASGFSAAFTDIYKKIFEEGWFGREVSAREVDISREPVSYETRMGFRELMDMQRAMLINTPETAEQARHEPEINGPGR